MALVNFQNRVFDPAAIATAAIHFPDPDSDKDQDVQLDIWFIGCGDNPFRLTGNDALLLWAYLKESVVEDDVIAALLHKQDEIQWLEDAA